MEKEYFVIDVENGNILDVVLLGEDEVVPEDHKLGWGTSRSFYNPVWDFELNDWVEGKSFEEILAPIRENKATELSAECESVIKYGFYHEGDFFAFYDKDQANFNQQLSLMLIDGTITSVLWKTENNGIKSFNREQFIAICKAGEQHKRQHIGRFWQIKEYVMKHPFNSVDELQSIAYETGITV